MASLALDLLLGEQGYQRASGNPLVVAERGLSIVTPDSTPARAADIPSVDRLSNDTVFAPLLAHYARTRSPPYCASNWRSCVGAA